MRKLLEGTTGAVFRGTWANIDGRPTYRSDADAYLRVADSVAAWARARPEAAVPDEDG